MGTLPPWNLQVKTFVSLLLLLPMTPQEAGQGGPTHNTDNDSAGCILHCFFTHIFLGRPEVPDLNFNLGSVIERGTKVEKK